MTHGGVLIVTVKILRSCGGRGLSERRMEEAFWDWMAVLISTTIIRKVTLILGMAASRRW